MSSWRHGLTVLTVNSGLDAVAKSKVPRPRQEMNPNINSMYGKYLLSFSVTLSLDSLFLLTILKQSQLCSHLKSCRKVNLLCSTRVLITI
jgi:hypothetical protein